MLRDAIDYVIYLVRLVGMLLLLALILIDCIGSLCVGESFYHTLSAKAHDAAKNKQPYWGWTERFINGIFFWQKGTDGKRNHCQRCWVAEQGATVWALWARDWTRT